jgi:RHS repeat-associated protein
VATEDGPVIPARQQEELPSGTHRGSGNIPQPTLHATGQSLDRTGLVEEHARYDDPAIGRFISADRVVPGAGPLTLAPHDATARAAWGQGGGGPANPQELNRYAYAANNPVRNTDPTGHCPCLAPVVPWAIVTAKAALDAVLVAVGGYLIYDRLQQMATTPAQPGADGGAAREQVSAAPEAGPVLNHRNSKQEKKDTSKPNRNTWIVSLKINVPM